MTIPEAMEVAGTEHGVFFLLTAYIETLHYYEASRAALHPRVIGLPLGGTEDVAARLQLLHVLSAPGAAAPWPLIEEAIDVFSAASRRLSVLHTRA